MDSQLPRSESQVKRVEHLREDLQEMKWRPALLVAAVFTLGFIICSAGSVVAGRAGHVLVIVAGLPLSLFTMPLLDTIEDPAWFAAVLYGLNYLFGATFWLLSILVITNFNLFLARRKLDILLFVIIAVIVLSAFTFKQLRGYGFFIGLEGKAAWKEGLPHKRVFAAATSARGAMIVSGMGWVAHFHKGQWVHFNVPGKSRKHADSLVSLPDDRFLAKFGSDVYEITHQRWTRIPLKRASGTLAVNRSNEVVLFSVEGLQVMRGLAFQPVEVNAECVPNDHLAFVDSRGWLWSGGKLGNLACVFTGIDMVEVKVRNAEGGPAPDTVTAIVEGPDLTVYLGTESGAIYRVVDRVAERLAAAYPADAGRVTTMLFDGEVAPSRRHGLAAPAGKPLDTVGGAGRDLIVVYEKAGVHRLNTLTGAIVEVAWHEIKGLKHLCCLVRDDAGHIWLGTNKGLIKYK